MLLFFIFFFVILPLLIIKKEYNISPKDTIILSLYFIPSIIVTLVLYGTNIDFQAMILIYVSLVILPFFLISYVLFKTEVSSEQMILFILSYVRLWLRQNIALFFENGIVIVNNNTTEILYYINDTQYRICFQNKRGPKNTINFERKQFEKTESQCELFKQYLGPNHDFHGISTTPRMLGFDSETIIIKSSGIDVNKEYGPDEIISL
jgi:hypothetical protein